MADIRSWDERAGRYIGFSGRGFDSPSRTITRPNDTQQYTTGDAYGDGTAIVFGTCNAVVGGGGILTHAVAALSVNQSTKPNWRLYLFSGSPTVPADNATWNPSHATLGSAQAKAEFTTWEIGGTASGTAGNCFSFAQINHKFRCASGDTKLYGVLVERGTYSPLAQEQLTITVYGEMD